MREFFEFNFVNNFCPCSKSCSWRGNQRNLEICFATWHKNGNQEEEEEERKSRSWKGIKMFAFVNFARFSFFVAQGRTLEFFFSPLGFNSCLKEENFEVKLAV